MTTYKILAQSLPTANTETVAYSTPSASASLVRSINVTNTSGTADTFDISLVEDGNVPISVDTYVAVSANFGNAAAASSTDAITWTARTMPSAQSWCDVSVGNDVFVSVSNNSAAATSTNGITWTARTLPVNAQFLDIAYGNGRFVTAGISTQTSIISTNGISWAIATIPFNDDWRYISYGDGLFVLASSGSGVVNSTDGITWTQGTFPAGFSTNVIDLVYGGGVFLALGYNGFSGTSTNGITWTGRTTPTTTNLWRTATYGNGIFVAASYNNSSNTIYSTDGITWTQGVITTIGSQSLWNLNFYNNVFFAIGEGLSSSQVATSTNGITWTARSLPSSTGWNGSGAGSYYISSTTANQDYIFKSTPILGNETITVKAGYTMSQNDQVRVRSNNGTSNFHVFGAEI
jgi:hypothetical protein